jgi:hypothetical protein
MSECVRCGRKIGRREAVGSGVEIEVTWAVFASGGYHQQFGDPLFKAEIPRGKHFCVPCLNLLGDAVKGAFDGWREGTRSQAAGHRFGPGAAPWLN